MNGFQALKPVYLPIYFSSNVNLHKVRFISTFKAATVTLDEGVFQNIENDELKPRKHPGIVPHGPFTPPKSVKNAILNILKENHKKQLFEEAKEFRNYLWARDIPIEKHNMLEKKKQIEDEVKQKLNVATENLSEDELKRYYDFKKMKVKELLKQRIYHWNRLDFTHHLSLVYLVTRSTAEYAAISHVFGEIYYRTNFVPKSVFDFGSGVGSVIWAANNIWGNNIAEYFCVDSSSHMISLSETIIKQCYEKNIAQRIFHRQFLPSSKNVLSDLVVSAYSLLEMSSQAARLETVKNLWLRTEKYLVLIELGTTAGFTVLNEARDYLLSNKFNDENIGNSGHVFAPCPHDLACPKAVAQHSVCSFPTRYFCFPETPEKLRKEFFCYIVLEKGSRKSGNDWPRLVQPVLLRSKHVVCRFCTKSGELNEVIFTPSKHGKATYKCAKSSSWGDLFPGRLSEKETLNPVANEDQSS